VLLCLGAAAVWAKDPSRRPPTPEELSRSFPLELIPRAVEPSAPPFEWVVPGALEDVAMAGEAESLGVPVRAHAVRSKERIEPLYLHFLKSFRAAGLYVPPPPSQFHMAGGLSLTAIDDERMISYTVIFQPNADRTTTVILGEANLAARKPQGLQAGDALPVPPSATGVIRSRSEGTTQLTFRMKGAPEEAAGFYRQALGAHGFKEVEPAVFSAGSRRVQVLAERAGKDQVVVAVLEQLAAP
jgi:hypothetical protein